LAADGTGGTENGDWFQIVRLRGTDGTKQDRKIMRAPLSGRDNQLKIVPDDRNR
jgi:hypothetical protein